MLAAIGITTRDKLLAIGPHGPHLELEQLPRSKPSLNLLYSMKLVLDDRPWTSLTKERVYLIMKIEAWHEYQSLTADEVEK